MERAYSYFRTTRRRCTGAQGGRMGSKPLALVALLATTGLCVASGPRYVQAQTANPCGPTLTGSVLPDTPVLRSTNGVLAVRMTMRQDPSVPQRMCYAYSAVV